MASARGFHVCQRICRVLRKTLPQALALRRIGQCIDHERVQAHAHLPGIFFELQFERAGQLKAGGAGGRRGG